MDEELTAVAQAFLAAYTARDWGGLADLMMGDVSWDLPGEGPIAGRAVGREAVVQRVRLIVGGGTQTELLHTLTGVGAVALSLHNTAEKPDGRVLDEYLTTLLRVRDGKIAAIETYLSDVPMMERFFAGTTSAD